MVSPGGELQPLVMERQAQVVQAVSAEFNH